MLLVMLPLALGLAQAAPGTRTTDMTDESPILPAAGQAASYWVCRSEGASTVWHPLPAKEGAALLSGMQGLSHVTMLRRPGFECVLPLPVRYGFRVVPMHGQSLDFYFAGERQVHFGGRLWELPERKGAGVVSRIERALSGR